MSDTAVIHRFEDKPAPSAEDPKVFVRSISTPGGAPWDQRRAASLEARLGAPAPLDDLVYQVRRLDPWRFNHPSRFAAFYVRAGAVKDQLTRIVEVDDRPFQVRFLSPSEQSWRARRILLMVLFTAVSSAISLAAIGSALRSRNDGDLALAKAERSMAIGLKTAETAYRMRTQARALDALDVRHLKVSNFVSDLNWASASKSPDAHIEALHWEHGAMAVEVRGAGAPFTADNRIIRKSQREIRPGVWLWGVAPETIARRETSLGGVQQVAAP